jgi:RNA polymerase sigma-B factor
MTTAPRVSAERLLPRQSTHPASVLPPVPSVPAPRHPADPTTTADLAALASMAADDPARAALRDRLVERHLQVVRALAARYRHLGEPWDDLVQVGTIGLIEAIDRFDGNRGVPLLGYATPFILGEIRRHLRDLSSTVRIPRQVQEVQQRITAATADLAQHLHRAPTVAEVARASGVDPDLVVESLEARRARTPLPLHLTAIDPADVDETALDDVLQRESLRPALAELDERAKRILALRFFRGLSQREIAAELGISQMHVSRLLARTLEHVRTRVNDVDGPSGVGGVDAGD